MIAFVITVVFFGALTHSCMEWVKERNARELNLGVKKAEKSSTPLSPMEEGAIFDLSGEESIRRWAEWENDQAFSMETMDVPSPPHHHDDVIEY
jgi:hypothetical protein